MSLIFYRDIRSLGVSTRIGNRKIKAIFIIFSKGWRNFYFFYDSEMGSSFTFFQFKAYLSGDAVPS